MRIKFRDLKMGGPGVIDCECICGEKVCFEQGPVAMSKLEMFSREHVDCKTVPVRSQAEIIDYEVITGSWASQVVVVVKQMMTEGWKPWGNMLVATSYEHREHYGVTSQEYSQVMVKYK